MKELLERLVTDCLPYTGQGKVAVYIPELASVDPHKLGVYVEADGQACFAGDYQKKINSPIITTGNELTGDEIVSFSQKLCIDELYAYLEAVDSASNEILGNLAYEDIKRKLTDDKRTALEKLGVVSDCIAEVSTDCVVNCSSSFVAFSHETLNNLKLFSR